MKVIINLLECSDSLETVNFMWQRWQLGENKWENAKEQMFCFLLVLTFLLPCFLWWKRLPFSMMYALTLFQVEIESYCLALHLDWGVWFSSLDSLTVSIFLLKLLIIVSIICCQRTDFDIRGNLPYWEIKIYVVLAPLTEKEVMKGLHS